MMTTSTKVGRVSQADRDMAVSLLRETEAHTAEDWLQRLRLLEQVAAGRQDHLPLIQALMMHRIQAEEEGRAAGIARALHVAVQLVRARSGKSGSALTYDRWGHDIEAALRALSSERIPHSPPGHHIHPAIGAETDQTIIRYG